MRVEVRKILVSLPLVLYVCAIGDAPTVDEVRAGAWLPEEGPLPPVEVER
jgi:hypothetical protein